MSKPKLKSNDKLQPYAIDWIDTCYYNTGWKWRNEFHEDDSKDSEKLPQPIRTLGYIVYEDKDVIVLTASLNMAMEKFNDHIVIPIGCVAKRHRLKL